MCDILADKPDIEAASPETLNVPSLAQRIRQHTTDTAAALPPEMSGPGMTELVDWADEVDVLTAEIKLLRAEKASSALFPTVQQIEALASAAGDVLDDMGAGVRTSTCLFTKATVRVAFEPFKALMEDDAEFYLPLDEAERIVRDTNNGV